MTANPHGACARRIGSLVASAMLALAPRSAWPQPAAIQERRLSIPRLDGAPTLADFEEMAPRGAAASMAKASGFIDRLPRDGAPMSERTDVYLGYDDSGLHAVFVCFDSDASQVRAHLSPRDRVPDSEDSVALQLDTFRDRKHAYGFQVNALGVQQDGVWTEGKGWDLSFDTVWRSDARLTPQGYLVLVSVPFASLRFPREESQTWGLLLFRGIGRRNEEGFWPVYSTTVAGRMNQAAPLEGIRSVSPGRSWQLVPYWSAQSYRLLDRTAGGGRFVSDPADMSLGADAKLVLRDSVSLDVTANPDFSQVESDEPQATVNRRFETFFPEKRPFFLENASFFDTPIPLLFTRRIVEPRLGGRLTGRWGPYAFGALTAGDRPANVGSSTIGVLRLNRDLGAQSSLGMFWSLRDAGLASNEVAGLDTRLKIGAHVFATAQAVASRTQQDSGAALRGPAYRASLQRAGRSLSYSAVLNDRSPGFHTALGFVERTDIRSLEQTASYRWWPMGSRLLSFGPDLDVTWVRDHRNRPLDRTIKPKVSFEWPGLTRLTLFHQDATVRLRPEEVASVTERVAFPQDQWGLEFTTSFSRALTLTVKAAAGDGINLAPPAGTRPALGDSREVSVAGEVRPSRRFALALSALFTTLREPTAGDRIFDDRILRAKVSFQVSRALSARTILQYDDLRTTARLTSLRPARGVNADLLLAYVHGPGTALYLGYNNNYSAAVGGLVGRRLASDGRRLFVKASYLWRP